MVMPRKDLEARVKTLEQQLMQLSEALGLMYQNGRLHFSSQGSLPPSLSFIHGKEGAPARSYGTVEAGDFGEGYRALRVKGANRARLDLISESDILMQAGNSIHLNARHVKVEAKRLDLDGELSARLCATEPFSWKSGQLPARLVHHSHGIPVLTELKGKFRNNSSGIRMYVDPEDGYWYLTGDSSKGADISAQVICIGRV